MDVTQADKDAVEQRLATSPVGQLDPAASLLAGNGFCPFCANEVGSFRDELSLREYRISGLCQSCQDSVFGVDLEGPMETPVDPADFS